MFAGSAIFLAASAYGQAVPGQLSLSDAADGAYLSIVPPTLTSAANVTMSLPTLTTDNNNISTNGSILVSNAAAVENIANGLAIQAGGLSVNGYTTLTGPSSGGIADVYVNGSATSNVGIDVLSIDNIGNTTINGTVGNSSSTAATTIGNEVSGGVVTIESESGIDIEDNTTGVNIQTDASSTNKFTYIGNEAISGSSTTISIDPSLGLLTLAGIQKTLSPVNYLVTDENGDVNYIPTASLDFVTAVTASDPLSITHNGTTPNVALTGTVAVAHGGTGQNGALTQGGIIYGSSTTTMESTSAGNPGDILVSNGVSTAPNWEAATTALSGLFVEFNQTGVQSVVSNATGTNYLFDLAMSANGTTESSQGAMISSVADAGQTAYGLQISATGGATNYDLYNTSGNWFINDAGLIKTTGGATITGATNINNTGGAATIIGNNAPNSSSSTTINVDPNKGVLTFNGITDDHTATDLFLVQTTANSAVHSETAAEVATNLKTNLAGSFIDNQLGQQSAANFNVAGSGTIGNGLTVNGGDTINGTTAINITNSATTTIGSVASGGNVTILSASGSTVHVNDGLNAGSTQIGNSASGFVMATGTSISLFGNVNANSFITEQSQKAIYLNTASSGGMTEIGGNTTTAASNAVYILSGSGAANGVYINDSTGNTATTYIGTTTTTSSTQVNIGTTGSLTVNGVTDDHTATNTFMVQNGAAVHSETAAEAAAALTSTLDGSFVEFNQTGAQSVASNASGNNYLFDLSMTSTASEPSQGAKISSISVTGQTAYGLQLSTTGGSTNYDLYNTSGNWWISDAGTITGSSLTATTNGLTVTAGVTALNGTIAVKLGAGAVANNASPVNYLVTDNSGNVGFIASSALATGSTMVDYNVSTPQNGNTLTTNGANNLFNVAYGTLSATSSAVGAVINSTAGTATGASANNATGLTISATASQNGGPSATATALVLSATGGTAANISITSPSGAVSGTAGQTLLIEPGAGNNAAGGNLCLKGGAGNGTTQGGGDVAIVGGVPTGSDSTGSVYINPKGGNTYIGNAVGNNFTNDTAAVRISGPLFAGAIDIGQLVGSTSMGTGTDYQTNVSLVNSKATLNAGAIVNRTGGEMDVVSGTSGSVLVANGTSAYPTFQNLSGTSNQITVTNGITFSLPNTIVFSAGAASISSASAATGANLSIAAGQSTGANAGGNASLTGGVGGTASTDPGGNASVAGGAAASSSNANGGNVLLTGGAKNGTGANGTVIVNGTSAATTGDVFEVNSGASTSSLSVGTAGALTMSNAVYVALNSNPTATANNYSVSASDFAINLTTGGGAYSSVTLPAAPANGRMLAITNYTGAAVNVKPGNGTDVIGNLAVNTSYSLANAGGVSLVYDATAKIWTITGKN